MLQTYQLLKRSGGFVVLVDRRSTANVGGFALPRLRGLAFSGDTSGGAGAGGIDVGVDFVPGITGILFRSIRRLRRKSRPAGVFNK